MVVRDCGGIEKNNVFPRSETYNVKQRFARKTYGWNSFNLLTLLMYEKMSNKSYFSACNRNFLCV